MSRSSARALVGATLMTGYGAILLFVLFLFVGSFTVIGLGLDGPKALAFDASLCLLFFVQHSVMLRRGTRKRLASRVPDDYYGAFFAVASALTLLVMLLLWQEVPGPVAKASGVGYWALRALFVLCFPAFYWAGSALGSFDAFGTKRIGRLLKHRETRAMPMVVRGAYRWVRHPLYLICVIMFWACPVLTADRLLFNVLWTSWVVLGTLLEERDLAKDFGDAYREYQRKVPMLIPHKAPVRLD